MRPCILHAYHPMRQGATKDGQIDCPRLRCHAPKEVVATVAEKLKFDLKQYEEE